MKKVGSPWSVPVAVEDIPDTGLHIAIEAPGATRAELAELVAVRELSQLSAVFDLIRQGSGVHVLGQVSARVGQTCVVTLEPMESTVEESVDLQFAPVSGTEPEAKSTRTRTRDNEPSEPLVGGTLDLGALATEFLILGIDPYPRKAGAQFALPKFEVAGEHPFAALELLKKNLGGGKS